MQIFYIIVAVVITLVITAAVTYYVTVSNLKRMQNPRSGMQRVKREKS